MCLRPAIIFPQLLSRSLLIHKAGVAGTAGPVLAVPLFPSLLEGVAPARISRTLMVAFSIGLLLAFQIVSDLSPGASPAACIIRLSRAWFRITRLSGERKASEYFAHALAMVFPRLKRLGRGFVKDNEPKLHIQIIQSKAYDS